MRRLWFGESVMPLIRYPADLPIAARREEIIASIRQHQVVILAGETGSGKTTQLPKMCLEVLGEQGRGQIGCTQPRRVAAMSVSRRVAEELQVQWGREVGCKMRFSDDTNRDTRIKFMTDGILLAEIQSDPMLRSYSLLILDEAHERSLNIDFLLGYLQQLLPKRPDLKVLVTSATIDTEAFSQHFGGAPIIEVSGRLYPVEIRYAPFAEDEDEPHLIDAAAAAVENCLAESSQGDVLVFMPTERDIRETCDLIQGRCGSRVEVLGLYGRMAAAEQQRVFAPGPKRRIIVATNVAETSITIPRIRYVVDTGLARVSRYNPRTRTKRLPVEAISQSSANQRAGRAGRVEEGVCIRLYSEEEFAKRPRFTTPEIQRANLAEVILRMKAFKLGEIETFPFINPPVHAAIRSGYQLLHELGALTDVHEMSGMGHDLARLPLDPTLGRMLLQAAQENCLEDMIIIAAGLSIPDPRERPEEKKEMASAAHKAFASPDSDFMSLLKIWQAAPDQESTGKNALRKFCKASFLSFIRMQEWRDVWKQLRETMRDIRVPAQRAEKLPSKNAMPDAPIHRCILSGQLGHIARREERNIYKAGGNRLVTLFPGSNLYERKEKKGKGGEEKSNQPPWVVAGEIVQTSQLFARTVAKIDPAWIAELGAHLCEYKYSEPHWSQKAGRVLVTQRAIIHGLEVERRPIDFGKIDPQAATHLFIRGALIESPSPLPHRFYQHNQKLRNKIETTLTRVRSERVYAIEDALFRFYDQRIQNVSSLHDLNRLIQERGDAFLHADDQALTGGEELSPDLQLFPDQVAIGNSVLPISYSYKPGEEMDGVTVQVPLPVAEHLTSAQLQWMVPGLREELSQVMLRALPRTIRRQLMPIDPKAKEIAARFDPGRGEFLSQLASFITQKYGVAVAAQDWPEQSLPTHLRPRIEVIDQKAKTVASGRDLAVIQSGIKKTPVRSDAWDKATQRFERYALGGWIFGDVPETVAIEEVGGVMVLGYPGLLLRDGELDLRLFKSRDEALSVTPAGVRYLAEKALGKDIAWLEKELRSFGADSAPKAKTSGSFQQALSSLQLPAPTKTKEVTTTSKRSGAEQACEHILAHLLRLEPLLPLTEKRFEAMLEKSRRELPQMVYRIKQLTTQIRQLKDDILRSAHRYPKLEQDVERLVPINLLEVTPHAQLQHLLRYLKAVQIRAERAHNHPAKDAQKAALLEEYENWESFVPQRNHETFRWLLEEYRVSVYAQELGTAQPASVKRLESLIQS